MRQASSPFPITAEMHAGPTERFAPDALRAAAGSLAFTRGADYHAEGRVEILAVDAGRVLARVRGSEPYRCTLSGAGRNFSGACTCPAFERDGFCKHLVATALAANAGDADGAELRLDLIREHLRGLGVEALVAMIVDLALADEALWRRLELGMADPDENRRLARLRQVLDEATATGGCIDDVAAGAWASGVAAVLDAAEALIGRGQASAARRLAEDACDRIEDVVDSIDDSDGELGGLAERIFALHLRACAAAPPDSAELAETLFERDLGSAFAPSGGSAAAYAEVLGPAGLESYRRRAEAAWARIKPRAPGAPRRTDPDADDRYALASILDGFAARAGDVDARIAVAAKDLSSGYAYVHIVELCLAHDRAEEALRWAEEGLWVFAGQAEERLQLCAADLYHRLGRDADAEVLLRRAFDRRPDVAAYGRLKAVSPAAAEAAVAALAARLAAAVHEAPGQRVIESESLIAIHLSENRLGPAWAAARDYGCGPRGLWTLARASEEARPEDALQVYARLVEETLSVASPSRYEEACRTIERMGRVRAGLERGDEHAAYIEGLMRRHKARRTLVERLLALAS